ncbi:hypothetical protein LDK11_06335 [Fusobacterium nucleatum]
MIALEHVVTILSSLIGGGLLGILFEHRKRHAETEAIEADVIEKIQSTYGHFVEDYNKRYEELVKENEFLRKKIKELEERLNNLTK